MGEILGSKRTRGLPNSVSGLTCTGLTLNRHTRDVPAMVNRLRARKPITEWDK